MNEGQSTQAALWIMVIVQTIGAVDMPGKGIRKMPAPRAYVVIIVAMGILQLIADAGYGRAARSMAWATVLAAAVLGPFGAKFVSFLNTVASKFAIAPTIGSTAGSASPSSLPKL